MDAKTATNQTDEQERDHVLLDLLPGRENGCDWFCQNAICITACSVIRGNMATSVLRKEFRHSYILEKLVDVEVQMGM